MSANDEKKHCWENRNRILEHVNSLIGKKELVSVKDISNALRLTESFVIAVLEDEFGDVLEEF